MLHISRGFSPRECTIIYSGGASHPPPAAPVFSIGSLFLERADAARANAEPSHSNEIWFRNVGDFTTHRGAPRDFFFFLLISSSSAPLYMRAALRKGIRAARDFYIKARRERVEGEQKKKIKEERGKKISIRENAAWWKSDIYLGGTALLADGIWMREKFA